MMTSAVNAMTNATILPTNRPQSIPPSPDWYWVISWLTAITTATGNGIVIYLIITRRSLHLTNNYFILSLAVADISTGLFVIPVSFIFEKLRLSMDVIDILIMLINVMYFASIANICTLTVDRYISIVIPLKYFLYMDRKKVLGLISASWIIPLIIAAIPIMYAKTDVEDQANRIYKPLQIFLLVLVPIILMLIVYLRIYIIARKLSKQTSQTSSQLRFNDANGTTEDAVNYKKERRERRNREGSVAVLGAVIILFALCYILPIYNTICEIFRVCNSPHNLVLTANVFLQLNSTMNPLVYAALKKDIRREIKKMFCGRRRDTLSGKSFGNNSSYSFAPNTSAKVEMR